MTCAQKHFREIRKKVDELLDLVIDEEDDGYSIDPRVDVESIVEKLGITVEVVSQQELGKYRSKHAKRGEAWVVQVSEEDSEEERRFSLAHELGHIVLFEAIE